MSNHSIKMSLKSASPVFLVADVASTMRWYQANLGFSTDPFPESPPHVFCILLRDDVEIMLQQLSGYQKPDMYRRRAGGVWDVYIRIQGVQGFSQALARLPDIKVIEPLHRQPYGQTEVVIEDPNGYILVFAGRI